MKRLRDIVDEMLEEEELGFVKENVKESKYETYREYENNRIKDESHKPTMNLPRDGMSQRSKYEFRENHEITISASGVKKDNYHNQPMFTSTPRAGQYNQKSSNISISASGVRKNESQKTSEQTTEIPILNYAPKSNYVRGTRPSTLSRTLDNDPLLLICLW